MISPATKAAIRAGFLIAIIIFGAKASTAEAFTGTIELTCDNATTFGGISCNDNVFTVTGFSSASIQQDGFATTTNGQVLYYTFALLTTDTGSFVGIGSGANSYEYVEGSQEAHALTIPQDDSTGPNINFDDFGTADWTGTIGDICISDSPSGCPPLPTPPVPTTTPTTSITYIDNPNQDIFNGILVFFMTMFGILWLFKRLRP